MVSGSVIVYFPVWCPSIPACYCLQDVIINEWAFPCAAHYVIPDIKSIFNITHLLAFD